MWNSDLFEDVGYLWQEVLLPGWLPMKTQVLLITHMSNKSGSRFRSLLVCSCDVIRTPVTSLCLLILLVEWGWRRVLAESSIVSESIWRQGRLSLFLDFSVPSAAPVHLRTNHTFLFSFLFSFLQPGRCTRPHITSKKSGSHRLSSRYHYFFFNNVKPG